MAWIIENPVWSEQDFAHKLNVKKGYIAGYQIFNLSQAKLVAGKGYKVLKYL